MKTTEQEFAQVRALEILGWLVGNEELLQHFMGATGTSAEDLRNRAGEPEFLASVLDFIQMDDAWVVEASEAIGQAPEEMARVRAGLPGGDLPNWT